MILFFYNRFNSALNSTFALGGNNTISFFGGYILQHDETISPLMSFVARYGIVGYALIHIFLYFLWKRVFHFISLNRANMKQSHRVEFALFVIMVCYYSYPLGVFSDVMTPMYLYAFLLLSFVVLNYQKSKSKLMHATDVKVRHQPM